MSGFSQREDGFEKKFAFDAEKRFRATARRNKMLAAWIGERTSMTAAQVAQYAVELEAHDLKKPGDDDVAEKLVADLKSRGLTATTAEVRAEMSRCMSKAVETTANEG